MQDVFFALRRIALNVLLRLHFVPPLLARFVIGFVFVNTGWGKLHSLDHLIEYFTDLKIPFPQIQAPFVAGVEFVCGSLVLLGIATRLAAVPLIGTMVVAIATALWPDLEGLDDLFGRAEFLYIVLLVGLVIRGAGAVSIDALLAKRIEATAPSFRAHRGNAAHAGG
jgi:putative oxidoreductase